MDDLPEDSATPQEISEAVKHELSQVESMIRDLTPTNSKAEQPTVKQDRTVEDLRNQNLQLELDLTRTKLELLKLQRESTRNSPPKMVATDQSTTPGDNPTSKPTLKWCYDQKNHFLFFLSILKEYSLNIQLGKFWALCFIPRLFILSVSFEFHGQPLLTLKTDR